MSKFDDLSGQKFGNLTVIERDNSKSNGTYWVCRCVCRNVTSVSAPNLKRGHTKSCGCLRGTGIIGNKYGKLTVLEKLDNGKYKCRCDCGNFKVIDYKSLTNNQYELSCKACGDKNRSDAVKKSQFIDGTQPCKLSCKATAANKSGVVGVNWDKSRGKWQASIRFKGHKYNLGRFDNMQDAIDVRKIAEREIFGNFLEWYKKVKSK